MLRLILQQGIIRGKGYGRRLFSTPSSSSTFKYLKGSTSPAAGAGGATLFSSSNPSNSNVKISHQILPLNKNSGLIHLQFFAKIDHVRPTNFVLAIDNSGSMGEACTYAGNPDKECSKYSRMDLVKHSAKTIIECLRPEDSLSLVTFSTQAHIIYHFTQMTEENRLNALQQLQTVTPTAATNLWQGLETSMTELNKRLLKHGGTTTKDMNNFIVLLSDGLPNQNPPRGIKHHFLKKIMEQKDSPFLHYSISNFGYGYDLDGSLLADLSSNGGGLFAHIPDQSMCNTVFINYLANCLSTVKNKIRLEFDSIEPSGVIQKLSVPNHEFVQNSFIDLGSLQSDSPKNLLLTYEIADQVNNDTSYSIKLRFNIDGEEVLYPINGKVSQHSAAASTSGTAWTANDTKAFIVNVLSTGSNNQQDKDSELMRSEAVYSYLITELLKILKTGLLTPPDRISTTLIPLQEYVKLLDEVIAVIPPTSSSLKTSLEKLRVNIYDLSNDNNGQIMKAFSSYEWFNRWGKHYIRYFISSILSEKCSNFKDVAYEKYSTPMFEALRNEIEEIFFNIPPPEPSLGDGIGLNSALFVSNFYSAAGPCFDGNGQVKALNRITGKFEKKFVRDVVKDDEIMNSEGQVSKIVCVLKTKIAASKAVMNEFHGVKITPWHPIRLLSQPAQATSNNRSVSPSKWEFPINFEPNPKEVEIEWFYDFVLDKHHIITINDAVDVIGLGHGITNDPVLAHPFFGTEKVLKELQKDAEGWKKGEVVIHQYKPVYFREPAHGNAGEKRLVDGFSL